MYVSVLDRASRFSCECICLCMYVRICACIVYLCVHTYAHILRRAYDDSRVNVSVYACMYVYMRMYCVPLCTHICTHIEASL